MTNALLSQEVKINIQSKVSVRVLIFKIKVLFFVDEKKKMRLKFSLLK